MTPQAQDQEIQLAGQTYTLRFSIKAVLALKDRWGITNDKELEKRMTNPGLEDMVTVVWAGLRTHHPELTENQVLGWMDDGGLDGLKAVMNDAIVSSRPPAKPGGPPQGQQRKRKTPSR